MTETARRKRRRRPRATGRRQGMTPPKIQGQRKVILAPNGISARSSAAAMSRMAPWCPRVSSILRRFLQGARPIHKRPETTLCAARAPPRRRVGSRVRETRFRKNYALAPNIVAGRRGRPPGLYAKPGANSAAFAPRRFERAFSGNPGERIPERRGAAPGVARTSCEAHGRLRRVAHVGNLNCRTPKTALKLSLYPRVAPYDVPRGIRGVCSMRPRVE